MSHVATCDIRVQEGDLDIFEKACQELGLELVRGDTHYNWYGKWVRDYHEADAAYKNGINPAEYGKCTHKVRIPDKPGTYEVGLVKHPDGNGYALVWDFYGSGKLITDIIGGTSGGKLKAAYAKHVQIAEAVSMGYGVTETINEDGNIQLEFEDYAYVGN